MQTYWFLALMVSICFEGLGRRYLPQLPGIAFYLLKDVVLLSGFFIFRPDPAVNRIGQALFRGFSIFWIAAFIWTLIEVANPSNQSLALSLIGLRSYWLWWLAPFLIATVLQNPYHRRRAIFILSFIAITVALLAAVQFVSPASSDVNIYTVVDGEAVHASDAGVVTSTGRARVASTFAFLTGFVDFTILVPALLLSLGLETSDKRIRTVALAATLCSAAVLPMSGSRSSVVLGLGVLALTTWAAGLFFTAIGRRIIIGGLVGVVLAAFAFPDAILGVQSRFDSDETQERLVTVGTVLPPIAIATLDFPMGGIGTGMMQNAAVALHVDNSAYPAELEIHRYLVELGLVGYLLVWMVKLGLAVAFYRAYKIMRRAGRRAGAGAALSYAAVTFFGNLTFDHIWQALFFTGAGFILAETKSALELLAARQTAKSATDPGPPPVALRA